MRFLVGTYTDITFAPSSSEGVYLYDLDTTTLRATRLGCAVAKNASYVAAHGTNAWAVSECGTNSHIHSIAIEGDTLRVTSTMPSPGADPCHIVAHKGVVYTANYTKGSIAAMATNHDGTLGTTLQHIHFAEHGTSRRQLEAHIHNLAIAPCGTLMAASNLGGDCVYLLKIAGDMTLTVVDTVFVPIESGPRHLAWSNDGTHLYLITELSEQVITFVVNRGKLRLIDTVTAARTVHPGGGDLHMHPSGRWLYASVRNLDDGIALFHLGDNRVPARAEFYSTGPHPRNFAITPCGSLLLCACRDKNAIEIYRIDPADGRLAYVEGHDIAIDMPVCITWLNLHNS